jgi:sphingosine kinase
MGFVNQCQRCQGRAVETYEKRVKPILTAAKCIVDVQGTSRHLSTLFNLIPNRHVLFLVTTHRLHAWEIVEALPIEDFDAILCLSGDGLPHEILNGLASRKDARLALKIPIVPIPTGSANGFNINLNGLAVGNCTNCCARADPGWH